MAPAFEVWQRSVTILGIKTATKGVGITSSYHATSAEAAATVVDHK